MTRDQIIEEYIEYHSLSKSSIQLSSHRFFFLNEMNNTYWIPSKRRDFNPFAPKDEGFNITEAELLSHMKRIERRNKLNKIYKK